MVWPPRLALLNTLNDGVTDPLPPPPLSGKGWFACHHHLWRCPFPILVGREYPYQPRSPSPTDSFSEVGKCDHGPPLKHSTTIHNANAESREHPNIRSRPSEGRETRGSGITKVNCDLVPKNIRTKQKYTLIADACISGFSSRPGRFYVPCELSASRRKDVLHIIQHANERKTKGGVQRCGRKQQ